MRRVRVLIIEDSAVVRELLRQIIAGDPRFEIAAAVASAEEGLEILDRAAPDVISLDIVLPGMQGIEATRRIMSHRPTPIVVVSASVASEVDLTMDALRAGALSVVEKPVATSYAGYEAIASRLRTQLAIMSEVKVVRQHPRREPPAPLVSRRPSKGGYRVLGIAASTGGPPAILEVLRGLGKRFPLPILVVQHMTPGFIEGFGSWLAHASAFPVEVVRDKAPLVAGKVYLAPEERHLVAEADCARAIPGRPAEPHRPSANVLFSHIARSAGDAGLGALLTGMGDDGAQGLLELREAGGYTIAEDESTAVVYGMPGAAVRLRAASEALPLTVIGPRIQELVMGGMEAR